MYSFVNMFSSILFRLMHKSLVQLLLIMPLLVFFFSKNAMTMLSLISFHYHN